MSLISALLFALYGTGEYADIWRGWIQKTFGRYMAEGCAVFAIITVSRFFSGPSRLMEQHMIETGYMAWALRKHETPLIPSVGMFPGRTDE